MLRVLADPLRARIVELLAVEPLCTCHLVEATGATQSGVSNQLRVLREAGLAVAEPAGRFTYYRLVPEAVRAASSQLAALAAAADAAAGRRRPC